MPSVVLVETGRPLPFSAKQWVFGWYAETTLPSTVSLDLRVVARQDGIWALWPIVAPSVSSPVRGGLTV